MHQFHGSRRKGRCFAKLESIVRSGEDTTQKKGTERCLEQSMPWTFLYAAKITTHAASEDLNTGHSIRNQEDGKLEISA
jgi:hypothetical protein